VSLAPPPPATTAPAFPETLFCRLHRQSAANRAITTMASVENVPPPNDVSESERLDDDIARLEVRPQLLHSLPGLLRILVLSWPNLI
jgi:hypothetical protein